jgi:NAD(P)-dependent dehydrogenase (short-subunit alcohol dehydrogenase family)
MSATTPVFPIQREPELLGQTVVVVGGTAGIGLETLDEHALRGPR